MAKLLRKLVNGIVPSWLTKIKSSTDASPKKSLPSSSGGTHVSSHKLSASSPSSTANTAGVLALPDHYQGDQCDEDKDTCTETCGGNIVISESPSLIKQGRTADMRRKVDKKDEKHYHQDQDSPHNAHLADVKVYKSQNMHNHGMQSSADAADLSSRKQEKLSIDKLDNDEHDHHPQQYHRNHNHREHEHQVEPHENHDDRKHEKNGQCMQEDANSHHLQETESSSHSSHEFHSKEFLEFAREFQCLQEQNSFHDRIHQKAHEQGARNGYEYQNKGCHDLLGLKRKSRYLKEMDGEEEEEEGGGDGSSSSSSSGWKRRKGERGAMSCELPESICCIVGDSKAVVKHSQDPHLALWESMVEMIVGNGLWELGSLEFLLFCYLSLNEPHLHPIIQSSFLQVLQDLERTS